MDGFNRQTVKTIGEEIAAAAAAVAAKHGVTIEYAGGSFDPSGVATIKVRVGLIAADGTVRTKEMIALNDLGTAYGLPADAAGRTFTASGRTFTVTGLNPRARKMPVIAKDANGKSFKFAVATVARALGHGNDALRAAIQRGMDARKERS